MMKKITASSEYRTGPVLDELREGHKYFIEKYLVFGEELEVERSKLTSCYAKWLGVRYWVAVDVRNLYIGLVREYGVRVGRGTLIGVGFRD